jgi:hypothetical protein
METAILTEVLPIEMTNGNDGRGGKWFKTANVRKSWKAQIRRLRLVRDPFGHLVKIRLTRILRVNQRLWAQTASGEGTRRS